MLRAFWFPSGRLAEPPSKARGRSKSSPRTRNRRRYRAEVRSDPSAQSVALMPSLPSTPRPSHVRSFGTPSRRIQKASSWAGLLTYLRPSGGTAMKKDFCAHGMPSAQCLACKASARSSSNTTRVMRRLSNTRQGRDIASRREGTASQSQSPPVLDARQAVIERIAAKHAIVRRRDWGLLSPNYTAMDTDWDYTTVVIHHSGNGGETNPKEIESKHMTEKGWEDVGYHYLIPPSGVIYEGRDLRYKGSHVEKANTQKIGILVMGDFESNWWDADDEPTAAQLTSAGELILTLKLEFKTLTLLGGHRDYKTTTECPGDIMYKQLGTLRKTTSLGGP
ncbi:N-acetylmuramoyl-L-alanine amidase [Stigmatella aurantiaca DW4/3-1]|uniref:N-acetylmuramoyl-L-alanine amidase n=1 Tax=Stigmatella aurantiaca (strain DW4/3-1) TaxID=378806 RepID=E3FPX7_STIAD|nr:N-acetylmuramoyl-L-alanine amidase [Stigmatella aurantiaca DW4/3-1]